ncbi:MAG: Crp/Fnr family transcriptional regulator [Sediminibacterium sp. Gen4]|jgi:CRP/FNR family transcriptional regulator, anaerobic regulatory protein|uniref:Crp/Fnr family transcriptional regulator n=1 Tax=unclassified Sediminibacterium TaxID=2635961 RepID=UPI0015BBDA21|nr:MULTISPECIES: Crp/Fnr family transcriptional regulator [unclassified Sediminibacterium]MBW0160383.1 Crp/Fnr family transcriptional regulator [Sediminibacterium sp.]MBW0163674.1 Crp/Fnr family transcriptional regulator [Sediminibacterium sp.]NWK67092.1 Crp/Fnr family transcriptional regulator [Sediminibacterium sp. Gen4]
MIPIEIIRKHFPFFEKALQEQIADAGEVREFEPGEILMKTGQNIRSTMLVISGLIKIFREDEEGNEFFMYYLQPGQACALSMVCAIRQETSQIMAKTSAKTEVITIPLTYMDQWMAEYKSWYHFVVSSYRDRFEDMLQTIDHIAFRNMDERLVFYLQQHQNTLKSNIVSVSLTEIAQELNSSREVISRLMKKLAEKGMIKQHKSHIEIINLQKLLS